MCTTLSPLVKEGFQRCRLRCFIPYLARRAWGRSLLSPPSGGAQGWVLSCLRQPVFNVLPYKRLERGVEIGFFTVDVHVTIPN